MVKAVEGGGLEEVGRRVGSQAARAEWAAEEVRVAIRSIEHGHLEAAKAILADVADALEAK